MSILMLVLSISAVMSTTNIIIMWAMLEINSFSWIFFSMTKTSKESILVYFLTQTTASLWLVAAAMMSKIYFSSETSSMSSICTLIMTAVMMMKLGIPPFHHWVVKVSSNMQWAPLFILLTIQKIPPLMIMSMPSSSSMMTPIVMLGAVLGTVSQLSTSKIKSVLAFSSISHTSWMSLLFKMSITMSSLYLTIYSMISASIFWMCHKNKINTLMEQDKTNKLSNMTINLLSLSGIPPLLGFVMKWSLVYTMIKSSSFLILLATLAALSIISTFTYTRFIMKNLLSSPNTQLTKFKDQSPSANITMQTMLTIPLITISLQ